MMYSSVKTRILNALTLAAIIAIPMAMTVGCAREVSHTETDKPGWFGGRTHEETTVTKNADGSTNVSHEKKTVNP